MSAPIPELAPDLDDHGPELTEAEQKIVGRKRLSRRQLYVRRFMRNRGAVIGLVVFGLLVLFCLAGGYLTSHTYEDVDFTALTAAPSGDHFFGTNGTGNDTFAQAVHGLQRSMIIAIVVSLGTTIIAAVVGAAAAYFGGRTEKSIIGLIHFLLVVPSFLILALISQAAGGDWRVLILVLTLFGWMLNARVVWSLSTSLREREYVQAARFMGVGSMRIVFRHLIPNIGSLLIITFTLGVVATVQSETALSFIGFGVMLPDVSLGTMLADGAKTISSAPWLFYFPSALLVLLTVSMALVGDGLRDALDPTSRSGGRA